MDWPRAKTILILAFGLLNLFLVYRIWVEPQVAPAQFTEVPAEEVERVARRLESQGILLEASLPLRARPMPFLEVGLLPADPAHTVALFMPGDPPPEVRRSPRRPFGFAEFTRGGDRLTIGDDGEVLFRRVGPSPAEAGGPGIWDMARARRAAEEFIAAHGGLPADARFDFGLYDPARQVYRLVWTQWYQGRPLFEAAIEVLVAHWGVKEYRRSWLAPARFEVRRRSVIPPTDALLRLAERLRPAEQGQRTVIQDVSLGFLRRTFDAEWWYLTPVWRVRTSAGDALYVSAYSGEPEVPPAPLSQE